MKIFGCAALAAMLGLPALPVQAQSVLSSGAVQRIYPASTGAIYFRLKSDTCNTGAAYYFIDVNHPALKNWYAMLLASAETGASITVAMPSATVCGTADHKVVTYLVRDY